MKDIISNIVETFNGGGKGQQIQSLILPLCVIA